MPPSPKSNPVIERPAPSNIEAEQALLGAILLEPEALFRVFTEPREFYLVKHRWIYEAMRECDNADFLSVTAKLDEKKQLEEVGGRAYLVSLLRGVASAGQVRDIAALVEREYLKREVIIASTYAADLMYNADGIETKELVPMAASRFSSIQTGGTADSLVHVGNAVEEYMDELDSPEDADPPMLTGLDLDKYTRGLKRGQFWLIGGDPGKGKTSLVMQLAAEQALAGRRVLVFSLEMTRKELMRRLASTLAYVSNESIDRRTYTDAEYLRIVDAMHRLKNAPLYIDDTMQSTQTMWMRCRALKAQGETPDLMICDYSRMLLDEAKSEDLRTNNISRAFKLMAREMNMTSMLVHWLNVSGGFKYGGLYDPDVAVICNQVDGKWLWQLEKNRNGDTCDVEAAYRGEHYRWGNLDKKTPEPQQRRPIVNPVIPDWSDMPMVEA